jgi:hypothetical protein
MLETCASVDVTLSAFKNAMQLFQLQKAAAVEVRAALYKSPRFKTALTAGFKEPMPIVATTTTASVLGKR